MKTSKKVKRALTHLDTIKETLGFYTNGSNLLTKEIKELYEILEDLSIDKKKDHIRLAKKLKAVWGSNDKENS